MKKSYQWRELTEDGLLREPKTCGRITLNEYGGFESEEEAIAALEKIESDQEQWHFPTKGLVLVVFYAP